MAGQMVEGDFGGISISFQSLDFWKVLLHGIVEFDDALIHQLQHEEGGDGLRDGTRAVDFGGVGLYLLGDVCVAVAARPQDFLSLEDDDGDASVVLVFGYGLLDLGLKLADYGF
jgi:hypothetical protein